MLLSLLALMMTAPAPEPDREAQVVAACQAWWQPKDVNDEATAGRVAGNGLCINGFLDQGTDAPILKLIDAARDGPPLIVVIRSGGGDFTASMNVAEALQKRQPTVIADTVCASSCADYIIVAGSRRIVRDDTFLVYHGGVTMNLLNQARQQIDALAKADPKIDTAAAVEQMRQMLADQIVRQDAFMVRAGVKPEIFAWMDEANSPATSAHTAQCPPDSMIIQYSRAALARFGLTFDDYGAPRSQAEADALIIKRGRDSKVCFWQD